MDAGIADAPSERLRKSWFCQFRKSSAPGISDSVVTGSFCWGNLFWSRSHTADKRAGCQSIRRANWPLFARLFPLAELFRREWQGGVSWGLCLRQLSPWPNSFGASERFCSPLGGFICSSGGLPRNAGPTPLKLWDQRCCRHYRRGGNSLIGSETFRWGRGPERSGTSGNGAASGRTGGMEVARPGTARIPPRRLSRHRRD